MPGGSHRSRWPNGERLQKPLAVRQAHLLSSLPKPWRVERVPPAAWLSEVIEPLNARFGSELTLDRDGDVVRWGFAGQFTIVELLCDGHLSATFLDRESNEAVSNRPACAAYRTHVAYALNRGSCSRMIADMCDFFSGVREPKFRFIDAYARSPLDGFSLSGTF